MAEREGEDVDEERDENEQRPDLGIRHYRAAKRPCICGGRVDRMLPVYVHGETRKRERERIVRMRMEGPCEHAGANNTK